jgi:hypothetical protein
VIAYSLPPLVKMHAYCYNDGLKLISNDDDYYYVDLLYSYDCLLECSIFRLHLYSCLINMAKMFKVKY